MALEGFGRRLREEGRDSEGRMSFEKIQKVSFSCSLEARCLYFADFYSPPCLFQRSPEVLGSHEGASRELLGACVWLLGSLGGVLGEACMTLEGPRGGGWTPKSSTQGAIT